MLSISGLSTKLWIRYLLEGSSGWSILKLPDDLLRLPIISTSPTKNPARGSGPTAVVEAQMAYGIVPLLASARSPLPSAAVELKYPPKLPPLPLTDVPQTPKLF